MTLPSPQSLPEFQRLFSDEDACEDYLYDLRWPDGFVCPNCGSTQEPYWIESQRKVECADCGQHVYLTAGTIMHKSHTNLLTWFYGAFLVTTLTPGLSAVQFQKQMGISRYETAFQILHKLRAAMVNPDREPLRGVVEVDETYVGGTEPGATGGRGMEGKTLVVGAVEQRRSKDKRRSAQAGRLRLRVIEKATAKELTEFVEDHVEKGTTVLTDAWRGYDWLSDRGYDHVATAEGHRQTAAIILPLIHLEFANLKTWLQGTHHGRVEPQHLQAYLNEFVFRHNRRFWPFSAFQTVLRLGMQQGPQEYDTLYSASGTGRDVHVSGIDGGEER
jgi:transposase-like protein